MNLLHAFARTTAASLWLAEDLVKAAGYRVVDVGDALGKLGHGLIDAACQLDELRHAPARLNELCDRVAELEQKAHS